MKPTSHRISQMKRPGANEFGSRGFPVIDSEYQSISIDGYRGNCADKRLPSFRSISNGYFRNEARHSFITEAAFFALIIVVSTWPVMQSVHAMADMVRAFGGF